MSNAAVVLGNGLSRKDVDVPALCAMLAMVAPTPVVRVGPVPEDDPVFAELDCEFISYPEFYKHLEEELDK